MAKNSTAAYHPRQIWATNLAPFVTAAREGAAHAASTANKQRARVRQEPRWRRQRWLVVTGAGLAVAGAVTAVCVAVMKNSSTRRPGGPKAGPEQTGSASNGLKSTVDAGREKVTGVARTMRDKLKGGEPEQAGARPDGRTESRSPIAAGGSDESRNQTPVAGGGYRQPL